MRGGRRKGAEARDVRGAIAMEKVTSARIVTKGETSVSASPAELAHFEMQNWDATQSGVAVSQHGFCSGQSAFDISIDCGDCAAQETWKGASIKATATNTQTKRQIAIWDLPLVIMRTLARP